MNDDQLQAWLARHGGETGRKNNEKEVANGPKDPDTGLPTKQTTVDSTTITAKDGATITLRRLPGPAGDGDIPAYEQVEETPPKASAATAAGTSSSSPRVPNGSVPRIEGTPDGQGGFDNTQPIRAWHAPDGTIIYEPLTPAEVQDWQRQRNGGKTDAEVRTEQATPPKDEPNPNDPTRMRRWNRTTQAWEDAGPNAAGVQAAETRATAATTAAAASRRADSAEARAVAEANKVGSKVESLTIGGQQYTRITKTSPDGKTTEIENYGPDGARIASLPSEGQATAGGPPMPEIFGRAAEQGLRTYFNALQADPSLTPAMRATRFAEAAQVAQIAAQNAATNQREAESTRSAQYNVASTKLKYQQDGLKSALDFASSLKLPEGSTLGGEAFLALMGLQMLQYDRSGMDGVLAPSAASTTPGQQPAPLPTVTAADLSNPQALGAKRAEIAAQTAQAAAVRANPVPAPAAAAPVAPARATPSAPNTSAAAPPMTAEQAADYARRGINPSTGEPTGLGEPTPPNRPDQTQAAAQIEDAISPPAAPVDPAAPNTSPIWSPVQYGKPGASSYAGEPSPSVGGSVLPDPSAAPQPSQYGEGGDTMSKVGEWSALAALAPPTPPRRPMQAAQASQAVEEPPAMRAARISASPPWRLSDDDMEWAQANGLLEHALRVPGAAA